MDGNAKKAPSFRRNILWLQGIVVIYTLASVAGKLAAGYELFSLPFLGFYALEILILGVYAILWQQVIKRVELSVAYANRSVALLWSMVWAALFFRETISWKNLLGVAVVIAGTLLVNSHGNE